MSNDKPYVKECIFCKNKITMSKETGKWLPYELNSGKAHDCKNKQEDDAKVNDKVKEIEGNHRTTLTVDEIVKRLRSIGINIDFDTLLRSTDPK